MAITTVKQIIEDAYRESNLNAINQPVEAGEMQEAFRLLERIVESVYGLEGGDRLESFPVGDNNIFSPSGFPYTDITLGGDFFIPLNSRLILNTDKSMTLDLHPNPEDGARFGIVDVSNNINTFPITVRGNGRLLESETQLTLDEAGLNREWFYRADLAQWMRITDLDINSNFPFAKEFDDFFITALAMRLNPRHGTTLSRDSLMAYERSKNQFRARYSVVIEQDSEDALLYMSEQDYPTTQYHRYGSTVQRFNRGYPW